jgi:hypothetical protein
MTYKISAEDYLKRARNQLDVGSRDGLFYAAFELRCGIEARMHRYLEARENITKLKKKGWKVAKMVAQIEGTFPTKGKICKVTILDQENKLPFTEFNYIPISNKLKKMAEKLGDYLHAQEKFRRDDDSWWQEARVFMEETYEELTYVSSGTLMGTPLIEPKTKLVHLEIELPRKEEYKLQSLRQSFLETKEIKIQVAYIEKKTPHNHANVADA